MKKIIFIQRKTLFITIITIITLSFTRNSLAKTPTKTSVFTSQINRVLPEPSASLLNGMIFGEKTTMPRNLYGDLIKTGTVHMIALSGMNITILINFIGKITLVFGRGMSGVLSLIGLISFIWLVGPSASVVRAGIMGAMGLIAIYFGRRDWGLLSLLLTAGLMLVWRPEWLREISFQLSFLATLGIITMGEIKIINSIKIIKDKKEKKKTGLIEEFIADLRKDLQTTLAAQIFTLPVVIYHFQQVSLVAPLTNILIGWTIPFVVGYGLVLSILALIWLPLAYSLAWILLPVLNFILWSIETTAKIPLAQISF